MSSHTVDSPLSHGIPNPSGNHSGANKVLEFPPRHGGRATGQVHDAPTAGLSASKASQSPNPSLIDWPTFVSEYFGYQLNNPRNEVIYRVLCMAVLHGQDSLLYHQAVQDYVAQVQSANAG